MSNFNWSDYKVIQQGADSTAPDQAFDWSKFTTEQKSQPTSLEDIGRMVGHFGEGAALGLGQGLANAIGSTLNLIPEAEEKLGAGPLKRIPQINLTQYGPQDMPAKLGATGGEIFGYLVPGFQEMKGVEALQKGLPLIRNAPALIQRLIGAAGAGFAEGQGNRPLGAAVGAAGEGSAALGARLAKPLINKIEPSQLVKNLQSKAAKAEKELSDKFQTISNAVKNQGISKIPVKNTDLETALDKAESQLPNTKIAKNLVNKARTGEFDSLRKLQTELWKRGKKRLAHDLPSVNDEGAEMMDVRNDINDAIENHLRSSNNDVLADMLRKNMADYKDYKELHFGRPQLARIFGDEQIVPKDPFSVFSEDSKSMNRFKEFYPEIEAQMLKHQQSVLPQNILKLLGKSALSGAGAYGGYKTVKDVME